MAKNRGVDLRIPNNRHFISVVGWADVRKPNKHLSMQLAWSMLNKGQSVSEVADKVGYQSIAAFLRALKKGFDTTVGKVRRGEVNN